MIRRLLQRIACWRGRHVLALIYVAGMEGETWGVCRCERCTAVVFAAPAPPMILEWSGVPSEWLAATNHLPGHA